MGDVDIETDAEPAIPRWWAPLISTFLALVSLAWLAVVLLPAFRQTSGLGTAFAILGAALFLAGLFQVLISFKSDARGNRRLILLNGSFALAVPLSALAHNAVAAVSGGTIEEPIFLLAAVFLPPAVIATSILLCIRALRKKNAKQAR